MLISAPRKGRTFERHSLELSMKFHDAVPYISFGVDNALAVYGTNDKMECAPFPRELPANVVLVGWQCGFEPMFVAVWSYLGGSLDDDEAEELATDALLERGWFANAEATDADYFLRRTK
jgi:hypothetical protein